MTVYTQFGGEVTKVLRSPAERDGTLEGLDQYVVELEVYFDDEDTTGVLFYDWRNLKATDGTREIEQLFGWTDDDGRGV